MKDDNYIVIQGWMINQLNLSGTALMIYAIIYGFTQDGETEFDGSLSYLQKATGKGRTAVIDNLSKLVESSLIIKRSYQKNQVTFNSYKTTPPFGNRTTTVRKPDYPRSETGPNNTIDNTIDNIDSLFPDEKTTFSMSYAADENVFQKFFHKEAEAGIDIMHYRAVFIDWCENLPDRTKTQKDQKFRTAKAWVSAIRRAIRVDIENKKPVLLNRGVKTAEQVESLKMRMDANYFD